MRRGNNLFLTLAYFIVVINILLKWFINISPVWQALIAGIFTWSITLFGAAIVFFFKKVRKSIMDALLGFSAGVMVAASFWSLLSPAIDMANKLNMITWLVAFIGFFSGGLLLFLGDKFYTLSSQKKEIDGNRKKRCLMLIFSIVLHNIPEGLVLGFAFGAAAYHFTGSTILSAITLTIGIGLQNFPEGSAVSLPLRREGVSRGKAFFYGQLSGIVEPIAAVIGAILVLKIQVLLPFMLSFAAGAMIYVVVEELIPEIHEKERNSYGIIGVALGFVIMMVLDITLG